MYSSNSDLMPLLMPLVTSALYICEKVIHDYHKTCQVSYISDSVGSDSLTITVNGSLSNNDDVQSPSYIPLLQQVTKSSVNKSKRQFNNKSNNKISFINIHKL